MYSGSLLYSIIDGVFYSVMVGFGETYFSPYLLSFGASDQMVGLLISLPLLAGALSQLAAPQLVHAFGTRKTFVRTGAFLQALSFLPIMAVTWLPRFQSMILLILVILYWVFALSISPAWQSWMGDLVPETHRGRYFSIRSQWLQVATFLSIEGGGLLLDLTGFQWIFIVAFLARLVSWTYLGKQAEPPYQCPAEAQFTFLEFVKKMRFSNYGLFVLYSALTTLAANIAAPYFIPYLLRDRGFSYVQLMLVNAIIVASKSVFFPIWGHYSDRYGVRKLLSLAGYLLPFLPFLWLLHRSLLWILGIQAVAGFVWAGYELCSFNFIFDCTTPVRRARCAAYYQLFIGVGAVLGALIGGMLLKYPFFFSVPYDLIFFVSGASRFFLSIFFLPKIREIRTVESISYRSLLVRMFLLLKPAGG